jgi:putative OmpL-like beta-barrel porin-2
LTISLRGTYIPPVLLPRFVLVFVQTFYFRVTLFTIAALLAGPLGLHAQPAAPATNAEAQSDWHYGGFLDLSYAINFNFPENHRFRSRTTTTRHNELAPNMALAYLRKDMTPQSRWGMEFAVQGGYDSKQFAFLQGEPKVAGADTLRHFSRANVSFLAPVGKGLTVTAGLFNSLLGYESLYAKDNFNYSRSWIADNTPYMMFGINARYQISEALNATAFVINDYYHLAHPNEVPSYGGQISWKPAQRLSVTETVYLGPSQADTSVEFWRYYANHITEWKGDDLTVAFSWDIGTERIAGRLGNPRAFVTGAALFTRWNISRPWSIALRPELFWDRNGRWTGSEQFVKAITTTLEYKIPLPMQTLLRLEHRYDESTGAQGGFFRKGDVAPGVPQLTPYQHLLFLSVIWSFDS